MLQKITIRIITKKIQFDIDITDTVAEEISDSNNYGVKKNPRLSRIINIRKMLHSSHLVDPAQNELIL